MSGSLPVHRDDPVQSQRNGKVFGVVSEHYTSNDCSRCGYRQAIPPWKRTYQCPQCGCVMDRDGNSPRNILAQFRARLGPSPERGDMLSANWEFEHV